MAKKAKKKKLAVKKRTVKTGSSLPTPRDRERVRARVRAQ